MYKNALKNSQQRVHPASDNFWHSTCWPIVKFIEKHGKRLKINIYILIVLDFKYIAIIDFFL